MAEFSYPNISFQESVIGPTPTRRPWRDRIGVVGEFNKGPVFPVNVSSRQEIVQTFGEDGSAASLQIQDALSLGATNFSICRAVPSSTSAKASFQLAAGNVDLEPITGFESTVGSTNVLPDTVNYTVGLSLELNYVGAPVVRSPLYGSVATDSTKIVHANFSGRANARFHVTDYVDAGDRTNPVYADGARSITAKVATSSAGEYQYIFLAKANTATTHEINYVAPFLRPGYALRTASTQELLIVAGPIDYSATEWALLVQTVGATTSGSLAALRVFNPLVGNYIIGYALELVDQTGLTPTTGGRSYFTLPNAVYNDGLSSYTIDSYFVLPVTQVSNGYIDFAYQTRPTAGFGGVTAGTVLTTETFGSGAGNGIKILYGSTGSSNIALTKKGFFTVPFAKTVITVGAQTAAATGSYPRGTSGSSILRDLERAILVDAAASSLISEARGELVVPPYTFTLETRLVGIDANRLSFRLTRFVEGTSGSATDINVSSPIVFGSFAQFEEGFSGPSVSFRDFYALDSRPLLRIFSTTPGSYGNQIEVTIVPQTSSGPSASFELIVTDLNREGTESERLLLDNAQIDSNGLYLQTASSTLIRAYFMPRVLAPADYVIPESVYQLLPLRVAPALGLQASVFASGSTAVSAQAGSFIRNVKLEGAFDYQPAITSVLDARKRGFLAALEQMEGQDIAFLILPGLTYGNNLFQEVFDVAKEQVENATVESGLRIALFDAPIGVSERQVAPLTASINRERVKLIVGHSTTRSLNGKTYPQVGSSGKAAGLMAVRPPRISVASTYGNFLIQNVSSVDTKSTPEYYKIVSQGHADMLYYDAGIRAYKFLNGITTSYDPNRRYDSVRRLMDQLISDLYQSLQWVRSEPNTRELQRRVSASVDARLQQGLRNGDLIRVAPTVCGPENNSEADMIAGRLNIAIRLTPVVPADFIGASVVRDLTENFSLQTVSSVPAF